MTARPDPSPRLPDAADAPRSAAEEARLRVVVEHLRHHVTTTPVPDAAAAWQRLRPRLNPSPRPVARRHAAWWWGSPILAAAAAAWLFLLRPALSPPAAATAFGDVARADFVQVADDATALVYVDAESGWLIVWASTPVNGAS